MKILFALFLIAHGLIHLLFITPAPPVKEGAPKWPFSIHRTWLNLSSEALRPIGIFLITIAVTGFVIAGFGTLSSLIPFSITRWSAIIASVASIFLIGIFWDITFIVGIALSIIILVWFFRK